MPFAEQGNLYDQLNVSNSNTNWSTSHLTDGRTEVDMFNCPSDTPPSNGQNDKRKPKDIASNSAKALGYSSYVGIRGSNGGGSGNINWKSNSNGVLYGNSEISFSDITDGTSNTVAISERTYKNHNGSIWSSSSKNHGNIHYTLGDTGAPTGRDELINGSHAIAVSSLHPTGAMFGLCDGSVRFIAETINLQTWKDVGERSDGRTISF